MSVGRYIRAAVLNPWNLLALAGAAVAGWVLRLPGVYWPILLAGEVIYVALLVSNGRFRAYLNGLDAKNAARRREEIAVMSLRGDGQRAFRELKRNCEAMLERIAAVSPEMVKMHREELARLAGIYLQLLIAGQGLKKTLDSAEAEGSLETQAAGLEAKMAAAGVTEDVKESLQVQREILTQRLAAIGAAKEKHAMVQSEITRIEQQVKLLRDQVMASTAPEQVNERIAEIAATLQGTTRWVGQQNAMMGTEESAPAVTLQTPAVRQ